MTPTEKLEELLVNLQIQLDLVLQAIKATTQNEAESKRFIMEAMQKYFGSSALQAKGSKSSSVFSRLEYLQEKESKPKTDAFGRMRPVDDDDEYSLPFVNKKGGSNDMKSITSSNDEDLMPTHNPFVKGLPLGSKFPSPPSRSGFVRFGDSSKESPFSSAAKGASPKPYYSPRGERTYQNSSARGRSGQRGRGREFENRGAARGWENRRNYDTKTSYRGSPSGSRGGYDFRSKNRYEQRSESKLDESPERRTPKFISRFGNGKSEKIDAFGKPRPIDDDDSPTPIRKTDAFGKPRPVDDDLDGSPLSIFSSKKTKSLENQESGAENSPSTSKKGISKSLKLSLERSEKVGSTPKIDAFGKPRPVDDEDDQFRLPVVHKNDSKLKIVPPTSFEKPETKNRKKVDAFGKPRPIDETEEVMPMCGGGKSIVDQIATSAVQEAKQFDSFGQIRPLNEVFGSNIPEENKSIWLGESKPILSPKIAALMENFKLQKF